MNQIKIIITDDQTLFREGLAAALKNFIVIKVIAVAANGEKLLEILKEQTPDILLLDLKMPNMDGVEVLKHIRKNGLDIKTIVLTMHDDEEFILDMIESGANSYLLKDTGIKELYDTILKVFENGCHYNEKVLDVLNKGLLTKKRPGAKIYFSEPELKVLKLICREFSNSEIGKQLYLSPRTIEGYKRRLQLKVGAKNLAGLIVYAAKNGLTE